MSPSDQPNFDLDVHVQRSGAEVLEGSAVKPSNRRALSAVPDLPPALVTIAIPTFNRSATVTRAIDSALAQTHERLEVLVGDDGSTDGTGEILAQYAARDERVRVVPHDHTGMVSNMEMTLRNSRGDFVMLLCDDDWLAPRAVEAALERLAERPGASAALGHVAYMRDGDEVSAGQPVALLHDDPAQRVRTYFDAVNRDHGNTWLYALMPRAVVERLSPMRNVLGFDWLHLAELAFLGPIEMVPETLIYRALDGTSQSTAKNVRVAGLPAAFAKVPHFVIAREVLADIGWRSPVYRSLNRAARAALATACAASVPARNGRHVLFHLAPDAVQRRWASAKAPRSSGAASRTHRTSIGA